VQGKIRLIGGKWRSRKLDVLEADNLRPTPDRIRETLFNWLSPYVSGAVCLDLYAGTGALGFEALSRGAASVVMVDHNRDVIFNLQKQVQKLGASAAEIANNDVMTWLTQCQQSFDIVFIDPPYQSRLLEPTIDKLINCGCLNQASLLYVESDSKIDINNNHVEMIKSGNAGKVEFQLLTSKKD